ncbi:hypothetical protein DNFV4_02694 [Nitrospira tepida]|uniref:Uncharacterized protein n=1 Tax=Nitrospira tepida TaxID=2973512 RepID=A0AA86T544_9BACT|nr:hypothetical protein [Nitrospira tepida]CAI4032265.1 hypothetical protein DNFV4_02694 [Nitrospira tepida]
MTIFTTRWRERLKWGEATVLLALLTALLVLGLSYFVGTYYQHEVKDYQPFDSERELQLQQANPEKR